jgi:pimeloyl-ACP methyl ester carboxylesterase
MDMLKIGRAHLVGTGGGALMAPDVALAHPERVLSVTMASANAGFTDPEFEAVTKRLMVPEKRNLPRPVIELGASYIAANPEGTEAWTVLDRNAWMGGAVRQPTNRPMSFADFATIKAPILLMTGDADSAMPPPRARDIAAHGPRGTELVIVAEAGHALFWEQPDAFNAAVLDFLRRHPAKD